MFTVRFPGPPRPSATDLERWFIEWGEACTAEGATLTLRSLPVRFETSAEAPLTAELTIGARTALSKLVAVLFDLSGWLGSDVQLETAVTRAGLWMRLADEQDRLRLATALDRAAEHANSEEVLQRLWSFLATLQKGHDLRWDAAHRRVVEILEVGAEVTTEEARAFRADATTGEVVSCPVGPNGAHILAWRWMSDNYPGYCDIELGSMWPR